MDNAINQQKETCVLLYQRYLESKEEQDCKNYLAAEIALAKYQLDDMQLKESRNTCWRVIKLCRENGGYGRFFSKNRILAYIEAYSVLGDLFYSRDDLEQARECYEKVISVSDEHLMKTECSADLINFFNIILYCHSKLSELFANSPFIHLKARYDEKGDLFFADSLGKKYHFDIYFIDTSHSCDHIDEIAISQYTLQGMQKQSANKTLQLCESGSIGTRQNPTPGEFVYVSFRGLERGEMKFQICYG